MTKPSIDQSLVVAPARPSSPTEPGSKRLSGQSDKRYCAQREEECCVSLIGMAGAGKSTIGRLLAKATGWGLIDTDHLVEAYFGATLQEVMDSLGREKFLAAEGHVVSRLGARRCIISTGGSVIYSPEAMDQLKRLGPVIHLTADLETIKNRIGTHADRGLAIAPGQSVDSLYAERIPLYTQNADFCCETHNQTPEQCADAIVAWLNTRP